MELVASSLKDLTKIAKTILQYAGEIKLFTFKAPMGAGKTTLIREICKQLKIEDHANSPTYSIVNEYYSQKYGPIYHFDFYRVNSIQEAFDFGYEDYIFSDNYCFIEWPDKLEGQLPVKLVEVEIGVTPDNTRLIKLCKK